MRDSTLVFNPMSGRRLGTARAEMFRRRFEAAFGVSPRMRATTSLADIRVAAREALEASGPIMVLGGDGTVSETLQGILETSSFAALDRPIGILPGGTGNSFVRDFEIHDFDTACDALIDGLREGEFDRVDAAMLRYRSPEESSAEPLSRVVMNIWGVGLVPDITRLAERMRWIGSANYSVATLIKIATHRKHRARVEIDGVASERDFDFITLSNSRYTGGSMEIAPPARANDGRLFGIWPNTASRLALLRVFPRLMAGTHLTCAGMGHGFARRLAVTTERPVWMNVDGELVLGRDPSISVLPGHWNVWMPRARHIGSFDVDRHAVPGGRDK